MVKWLSGGPHSDPPPFWVWHFETRRDVQNLSQICSAVSEEMSENPVLWQNWMAAYLSYTLQMKTLFNGWPIMVHDTHTRRRKGDVRESCPLTKLNGGLSQLHSADEDAVSWLTNYSSWRAYEKKKKRRCVPNRHTRIQTASLISPVTPW